MKLKTSFVSTSLLKENLKRFWLVDVVCFLFYFFTGPFMLLEGRSSEGIYSYYTVHNIITGKDAGSLVMAISLPVVAACLVFVYLFSKNSSIALHSQPFSRKTLFISNYVSGLVLSIVPLMFNTLILCLIQGSTNRGNGGADSSADMEIFTTKNVLGYMLLNLLIIFFVYNLSVLACHISGKTVIATLTSYGLNGVLPALYGVLILYAQTFSWGYRAGDDLENILYSLHPFAGVLAGYFGENNCLLWIWPLAAILCGVLAYFAYTKRKIEKTEDGYVFDWISIVIGIIIGFLGCSVIGLVFEDEFGIFGYIFGGLISFLAGQMVIKGSIKVLGKEFFRDLLLLILVVFLVIEGFSLDIFGVEKYIPDVSEIKSASLYCYMVEDPHRTPGYTAVSEEEIKSFVEIHRAILNSKPSIDDPYESSASLSLNYELKNGSKILRTYIIPHSFYTEFTELENYVNMKLNEQNKDMIELDPDKLTVFVDNFYIENENGSIESGGERTYLNLTRSEKEEIISAMEKDRLASYQDLIYKHIVNETRWRDMTYVSEGIQKYISKNATQVVEFPWGERTFEAYCGFEYLSQTDNKEYLAKLSAAFNTDCFDDVNQSKDGFIIRYGKYVDRYNTPNLAVWLYGKICKLK